MTFIITLDFIALNAKKTFTTQQDLDIHFEKYHKHYKYMCPECNKKFCSLQGYQEHYESIHLQLIHLCDFCDRSFKSASVKRNHIERIHKGKKYVCYCGKIYNCYKSLRQHQRLKNHL